MRRNQPMPAQCKTCIFREPSPLRPARMAAIQAYLIQGFTHLCHHYRDRKRKDKYACRGGRDYQLMAWHRMGIIAEPTDEALAVAMAEAEGAPCTSSPRDG